jgi:hypothetical protein
MNNDEIGIYLFVLWATKPANNDEIGIYLPVPVCCGLTNLRIMMKLGFTNPLLCAVGWQTYK